MGKLSREKGKRGELEVAKLWRENGFTASRGQQHRGGPGSPDVLVDSNIHVEVKRTERLEIYAAMDQAKADAPDGATPVVFHRRSEKPWLVVLTVEDFFTLVRRAEGWDF